MSLSNWFVLNSAKLAVKKLLRLAVGNIDFSNESWICAHISIANALLPTFWQIDSSWNRGWGCQELIVTDRIISNFILFCISLVRRFSVGNCLRIEWFTVCLFRLVPNFARVNTPWMSQLFKRLSYHFSFSLVNYLRRRTTGCSQQVVKTFPSRYENQWYLCTKTDTKNHQK